jgi:phosphate transport system substrate-binding protein
VDIIFSFQPSDDHLLAASKAEVELRLTPIAGEAFVFFVNSGNPVSDLSMEQIQDIYQKKITNWKEVGSASGKIMPFQRPENSGSQTIMLAKVMAGKPLPEPLQEEYSSFMGGIIRDVADYRNYASAIGYSFRYYATGMNPNEGIKLIAVGGVEPTIENIRSGAYPFTVDVYAVTAGTENENVPKLIEWILSDQGQAFIEQCGYVRISG